MYFELADILELVNSSLNNKIKVSKLEKYLEVFSYYNQQNQMIFQVMALPKLSSTKDFAPLEAYLNRLLLQKNFKQLEVSMKLVMNQEIKHQNRNFKIHINVKVRRKSTVLFCYGYSCLCIGLRYISDDLFRISCCKTHTYCKPCLRKYIINCFEKKTNENIPCEACSLRDPKINSNPVYSITQSEIDLFLSNQEKAQYLISNQRRKKLVKCESKLHYCPNKEEFIEKSEILLYECGDQICLDCDALSIIHYILEIVNCIKESPKNYSKYEPIGIMCPNRHLKTLKIMEIETLKNIFHGRKIRKECVDETLFLYEKYFQYFSGKSFVYCSNCNKLYPKNIDKTSCKECKKCFSCEIDEHPELTCDQFQNISNNYLSFRSENREMVIEMILN